MVILEDKKRKKRRIFAWAGGIVRREKFPIGGKLYYIDPNGDGEYVFYDISDREITEAQVAQAFLDRNHELIDSLVSYSVIKQGLVDKYYVYCDQMFTSKRWTYYDPETIVEGDPRYDSRWPGYAFESLGTSRGIGQGKLNTQKVMEKDGGVYVQANSNGYPTIWYTLKQTRDSRIGGCDDWFIPSEYEAEALRTAIGFVKITTSDDPVVLSASAITGGTIAGVADGQTHYRDDSTTRTCYPSATNFLNNYIWSSSENISIDSRFWVWNYQSWNYSYKANALSVFFARAF